MKLAWHVTLWGSVPKAMGNYIALSNALQLLLIPLLDRHGEQ